MTDHDRIIAQIRNLQALAGSTSVHEAAAASYAARKLIERHRISQAMLDEAKEQAEDSGMDDDPIIAGCVPEAWWGFLLLSIVADSHGLDALFMNDRKDGKVFRRLFLAGVKRDREIVKELFKSLFLRLRELLKQEIANRKRSDSWQQDWGIGAAVAVKEALAAARKSVAKEEAKASGKGAGGAKTATALALSSMAEQNRLAIHRATENMTLKNQPEVVAKNAKAFAAGERRGKEVARGST